MIEKWLFSAIEIVHPQKVTYLVYKYYTKVQDLKYYYYNITHAMILYMFILAFLILAFHIIAKLS